MILFKNATISSGITKERKVDILFDDKVIDIKEDSITPPQDTQVIDLDGKIVMPGCIDVHTHFRSSSTDWQNYFYNASKAAVAGGITLLADSSCNIDDPLTQSYNFDDVVNQYKGNTLVDFSVWGFISSDDYSTYNEEISELSRCGVVGIEFYLFSKNFSISPLDYDEILELFTDFSNSQILFGVFPFELSTYNSDKKREDDKIASYQFDAVKKLFRRSQESQIHLFNVASAKIVDFVINSTKKYYCTYDINPHIFLSNESSLFNIGAQNEATNHNYSTLIQTGRVPSISTNSGFLNNDINFKDEDFPDNVNYLDLQYMIPYLFSEYYLKKKLTLGNLERMLAGNPAKILGIDHLKGNFTKGTDADFVVFDPNATTLIPDNQCSFANMELGCRVSQTFVRGEKIYDYAEGIQDSRGFGKLIKRNFQATTLNYY